MILFFMWFPSIGGWQRFDISKCCDKPG
jgi:hypothetical protein